MTELELNKLFNKRVYANLIDLVVVFISIPIFIIDINKLAIFNGKNVLILQILNFIAIIFIYYIVIPNLLKGRTIGLYIMGLKIIYIKEKKLVKKIILLLLRNITALLTFYIVRIFIFPTMNNYGQLNFDEKYDITIIKENDIFIEEINKNYYNVSFDPLNYIKFFLFILILNVLYHTFF